jgi:arylsulfatase A-like enzyme
LALYYDEISRLDRFVGEVLAELARRGETENTFVLFLSDNGRPFPRDKTTLYDGGIKSPWIIRWPGRVPAYSRSAALISAVDLAPTILELAGLTPPETFQGYSFAALLTEPGTRIRDYAFSEHNWHDFEDRGRSVRTQDFKYIRNFYPDLPGTPPADAVRSPTYLAMRELRDAGQLRPEQLACFVAPRPEEELYNLRDDPFEMDNLAADPALGEVLEKMRKALNDWEALTDDLLPERRTPDEFDRETGLPLPNRVRPRPSKKEMTLQ